VVDKTLKNKNKLVNNVQRSFAIQTAKQQSSEKNSTIAYRENFVKRHVGPNAEEEKAMLKSLNLNVILFLNFSLKKSFDLIMLNEIKSRWMNWSQRLFRKISILIES
jgi:hypothetical protein